jgi:hypothetical protein
MAQEGHESPGRDNFINAVHRKGMSKDVRSDIFMRMYPPCQTAKLTSLTEYLAEEARFLPHPRQIFILLYVSKKMSDDIPLHQL